MFIEEQVIEKKGELATQSLQHSKANSIRYRTINPQEQRYSEHKKHNHPRQDLTLPEQMQSKK